MFDLDPRRLFAPDASTFPLLTGARARRLLLDERGAATAEYAVATMATFDALERITGGRGHEKAPVQSGRGLCVSHAASGMRSSDRSSA